MCFVSEGLGFQPWCCGHAEDPWLHAFCGPKAKAQLRSGQSSQGPCIRESQATCGSCLSGDMGFNAPLPTWYNLGVDSTQSVRNPNRRAWRSPCCLEAPGQAGNGIDFAESAQRISRRSISERQPSELKTFSSFRSLYAMRRSCKYSKALNITSAVALAATARTLRI